MRITLMGHMTVRIELDGMVLLTDPWFGPHRWLEERLAPRTVPPAAVPDELVPLDAMLVSHNHLDHLDGAALDLARRQGCTIIGSQHAAHRARKSGVEQAIALRRGEHARLGPLTIQGVYAVDLVVTGSRSCYFSSDTRFAADLVADLRPFTLDVALVQAACAHYPVLGDDGMWLREAADLARAVRPRWTVPLHLHCAGKWLDRAAGLRIEMDNGRQVESAVQRWAAGLDAEGLRVKMLGRGESWDVEA